MSRIIKSSAAAVALAVAIPAVAAEAPKEARIAFANHGGIVNWRALDRDTLLIEGRGKRWYKAELFAPAFDLPFANAVGFVTYPGGTFDRFSKVVVRGQSYPLRSLVRVDGPPPRKGDKAKVDA